MKSTYDVVNAIMEEYFRLYDEGKFRGYEWDDSTLSYPLSLPFPEGFTLQVTTYSDYSGEDDHFVVSIRNRFNQEVTGFEGFENRTSCEDLEYALFRAIENLFSNPWYDYHAEKAWQEFLKISMDADGRLQEDFLKFRVGDSRAEVIDWFGKIYRFGVMPLIDPPGPGEQISTFRIPLEWRCRGYIDVPAKNLDSALMYLQTQRFTLPTGEIIDGSVVINFLSGIKDVPIPSVMKD